MLIHGRRVDDLEPADLSADLDSLDPESLAIVATPNEEQ